MGNNHTWTIKPELIKQRTLSKVYATMTGISQRQRNKYLNRVQRLTERINHISDRELFYSQYHHTTTTINKQEA